MHFKKSTAKIAASLLLIGALVLPVLAVTGTVSSGSTPLNVRAEANATSNILGTLNNGAEVDVISTVNDSWYQIAFNGGSGYVSSLYVELESTLTAVAAPSPAQAAAAATPEPPKETALSNVYIQANDGLNIRSGPGADYDKVGSLAKGAVVQALAKCDGWYKISSGYVSASYVTEVPKPTTTTTPSTSTSTGSTSTSKGQQVADFAMKYVGYKYVYGGSSPSGFDCSGFTMYVYKQFGISLPHSASGQLGYGKSVSFSQLQPGDLVMFKKAGSTTAASHVGIYIGGGKFVHASTSTVGVIVSKMSDAYYTSGFVGGRRFF